MAVQRDRLARAAAASVPKSKRPPPGPPNFPKYVPKHPGETQRNPSGKITFKGGLPTSRPLQKFRGTDGKIHTAPAGSGPLNPIRIHSRPGSYSEPGPYGRTPARRPGQRYTPGRRV